MPMLQTRDAAKVRFDERGLVPCVVQDAAHRRGADARLHERGGAAAHAARPARSTSTAARRGELWHKGETSGNVQRVRQLRYDCDGDALVALVEPAGPACHTGERSCFYRDLEGTADPGVDAPRRRASRRRCPRGAGGARADAASPRQRERPEGSYTVELLDDPRLDRRQGPRGGRGGRQARRAPSPTSGSPRRRADVALPPGGAAALARRLAGRGAAGPERRVGPLSASAR